MSRLLLAILPLLISGATCQEPAPVELGRFPLRHAAFVQIYEKPDFTGPYPDKYRLVISTFDAFELFVRDPVFQLDGPGNYLDFVDGWDTRLEQLGDAPSAFFPNSNLQVPKRVAGFDGIIQTSGFIPPGKTAGQLEVYNMETDPPSGPWNIATNDNRDYSYHWLVWKDVDGDGFEDVFTARFHSGLLGNVDTELVWLKNPGGLGPNGEGWTDWQQFVLVENGPDVFIEFTKLDADGTTYEVLLAGELWSESVRIYYVEDVLGAWANPNNIQSNIIDDQNIVPFQASFMDINLDGTLEVLVTGIDRSVNRGALARYTIPADFRTDYWQRDVIVGDFKPNIAINGMSPGKFELFYPTQEYQNQETPFGPRKPWIVLSGDDDGKIYVVKPVSEDRDDFNYVSELLVDSGGSTAGTMAVVDLDGDENNELVFAAYTAGEVYVYTYTDSL